MNKGFISIPVLLMGLIFSLMTACTTTGGHTNHTEQATHGTDVFASKNWNAPQRNNMYDRWEFNADGTFHFWHVHHGEPLDRGVYRYELKDNIITIAKEGDADYWHYAYVFSGNTVTLTPFHLENEQEDTEHSAVEHTPSGGHHMGALPEDTVMFTHVR